MKRIILFLLIVSFSCTARSQEDIVKAVRSGIDSIISLIEKETDENKRVKLAISIYDVSIDGFPVLFFEAYQKFYLLSLQQKDIALESNAWSFAGQAYRLSGNYVKALECHHKAVSLAEKSGNLLLLAQTQNQMAHIYKDRLENNKALSLYHAAALNIEKASDTTKIWWPSMNLGAVYLNMGNLDSSLFYSKKAQEFFPTVGSVANLDYILANIGSVYSIKGDSVKAKKYFMDGLVVAQLFQSPRFLNVSYLALAEHFKRYHQTDSEVYYAKKAVEVVQNTFISNLALKPARLLLDAYQNSNADSALKYWRVYMAANDSLYNTKANQQLMMMSFEEDRRKQELENERKAYRDKIKTTLVLSALGVAILIMLLLYRNNRQRKKANSVLQKTLNDLKSTQQQLVHSEKMASLGELTAGIAHEIQNPLNFVNNFSELNNELIEEVKSQKSKLKTDELDQVLEDIFQNNEKITHHGKRADAIVKGMLQHSRNNSGQKELTDINDLADEYLRLAYHGLRAKDKSFNTTITSDFDSSLPKMKIVPQDIGRVILNLLNNAFYAVHEKAKQNIPGYTPTVSLQTKKAGDKIELKVIDNANGIPKHIIDKIFQPFFTTKPTGEGTGLGLSLAYDIITKGHAGDMKVETKEGEGTVFTIQLNSNLS